MIPVRPDFKETLAVHKVLYQSQPKTDRKHMHRFMVAAIQFWTNYLVLVIVYQTTCGYPVAVFPFVDLSHIKSSYAARGPATFQIIQGPKFVTFFPQ